MRKILEPSKRLAFIILIMSVSNVLVSAVSLSPAAPAPQSITDGQKAKVKGVIIKRDGDIVTVRTKDSDVKDVLLVNETEVESPTWWWANERSITNLVPGLRVEVKGVGNDHGQIIARKITFDSEDLKWSRAISGGVAPLEAEIALLREQQLRLAGQQALLEIQQQKLTGQMEQLQLAMRNRQTGSPGDQDVAKVDVQRTQQETEMLGKRISELDDYETRYEVKINFAVGMAELTSESKLVLDEIAAKALGAEGYLIEVAGYTDSTGTEAYNHQLSRRRAEAVIQYLQQVKLVPIRRVLTPAGLGASQPIADNSTLIGRAENRRAEVKVLVNRALVQK